MNVLATRLFQHAPIEVAGALLALILLALALAVSMDAPKHTIAVFEATPFRWV